MSALPSTEILSTDEPTISLVKAPAPDTTFADVVGPDAKPAELKKAIERESVWLPKAAAGGHGVRADCMLRYAAALDLAGNATGNLTWRAKHINARCGILSEKPKPVSRILANYVKGGLLAKKAVTWSPGQAAQVHIDRTAAEDSIRIPLGVFWEYRWAADAPTGPRYGQDTKFVLVWLAAWLLTATYEVKGVVYTSTETYMGLPVAAKWVAEKAGISLVTYRRAFAVVQRVCADADWVTWERAFREDDGHDAYRVTVDWSKAPVLKAAPQTPPESEQGTPLETEQGTPPETEQGTPPETEHSPSITNASEALLPSQSPAAHTAEASETTDPITAKAKTGGKEEEKSKKQFPPSEANTLCGNPSMVTALTGTRPDTAAAPTATHATTTFETWLLAVIAGVTDTSNHRRLALTARDVDARTEALSARYEGGWTPEAYSAWLTYQEAPSVSVSGAWRSRVEQSPTTPPATTGARAEEADKEAARDKWVRMCRGGGTPEERRAYFMGGWSTPQRTTAEDRRRAADQAAFEKTLSYTDASTYLDENGEPMEL
ncbi:hypothetical protein JOE61_000902 [Nocardioides salarius]|uniref:Uncharacterized protein n=1 Tax=Nocardioides salarius TaxID=374513 RepID=A0ABS2M7B8_9ACTN|nr:hypothetical protein [Nocardioides salarius]MBM7507088.1 hypothetical protein [Nocardioides salarius]